MRRVSVLLLLFAVSILTAVDPPAADSGDVKPAPTGRGNWPAWRGPTMNGVAPNANPPIEWAEDKNVKWKVPIPGRGSATPIIWGDKVFILTAVPADKGAPAQPAEAAPAGGPLAPTRRGNIQPTVAQQFTILAINRKDGRVAWQKVLREQLPHEGTHPTGSWASGSAVTDGEFIYAHFGSWGLYCLDMKGNLKWEKDLGDMTIKNGFGEGASPALWRDRVFINWDHEGESFIVALDKKSGKELWRTARDEKTAWATPVVVAEDGKAQVITSATSKVRSYDAENGKPLWETPGMTANTIPSPVFSDGMLYVTSGFRGNALLAIKLAEAAGDISQSKAIVWRYDRDTPYVPSPLLFGDELYFLKSNNGILTAFHAKTGEKLYGPERLEAVPNVYASPVGAGDRIYVVGREGGAAVVARGKEFKVLASNKLDDGFDASPAVADNEIYLRGMKNLYRISKD